jgi:hypothetical protein
MWYSSRDEYDIFSQQCAHHTPASAWGANVRGASPPAPPVFFVSEFSAFSEWLS